MIARAVVFVALGTFSLLAGRARAEDRSAEAALIAANPAVAEREGENLRLLFQDIVLRDVPCSDTFTDCEMHELDALFAGGRIAGVATSHYEGGDYTLYAGRDVIAVGERPIPSPDGRHLVAASFNDFDFAGRWGVSLVAVDEAGARLVRRVMPDVLAAHRGPRWIGTGCVAFEASTFSEPGVYGNGVQDTWYLVEDMPEWRLTSERAAACREQ